MKKNILSPPRKKRDGFKLLGVSIPDRVHNYLTFYSMAKNTNKSEIVQKLVYDWMNKQKQDTPDEILIRSIAEKVNLRWKQVKSSNNPITFMAFKDMAREELFEKGMNESYVSLILSEIER